MEKKGGIMTEREFKKIRLWVILGVILTIIISVIFVSTSESIKEIEIKLIKFLVTFICFLGINLIILAFSTINKEEDRVTKMKVSLILSFLIAFIINAF